MHDHKSWAMRNNTSKKERCNKQKKRGNSASADTSRWFKERNIRVKIKNKRKHISSTYPSLFDYNNTEGVLKRTLMYIQNMFSSTASE